MLRHFTIHKNSKKPLQLHNFLTSAFSHFKLSHLLNNMFTLFFFGRTTEMIFGRNTIFYLYILGALMGGLISYQSDIKRKKFEFSLGASSAVFSLLTFFILYFPSSKIYLYGLIGIPAWALGAFLFFQSTLQMKKQTKISHSAHFGGILGGSLYFLLYKNRILF